jgi:uncharacterized protein YdcH (DUF465 family)
MEKHDLHHEFPQLDEKIHEMKVSNTHFKKLFEEYHDVNNDIHRIEMSMVYTDDELKEMKTKRLLLKDKLLLMLTE